MKELVTYVQTEMETLALCQACGDFCVFHGIFAKTPYKLTKK